MRSRLLRTGGRILLLALVSIGGATLACAPPQPDPEAPAVQTVVPDWPRLNLPRERGSAETPVPRTLDTVGVDRFSIQLDEGDYFEATFVQDRVDLVLHVFGPAGAHLFELDSPVSTREPERLAIYAIEAGTYHIEVSWLRPADTRAYRMANTAVRRGTEADIRRAAAIRADALGGELRRRNDPASLRAAADRYAEAASLWRSLDNPAAATESYFQIGRCHMLRDANTAARVAFQEALALLPTLAPGHPREALIHAELGMVLTRLGTLDEARAMLSTAQGLFRQSNDPRNRVAVLNSLGNLDSNAGHLTAAERWYTLALDLWAQLDEPAQAAHTLGNLGAIYRRMGEPEIARLHYRQAAAAMPPEQAVDRAYYRMREADALLDLGVVDQAETLLAAALGVFEIHARSEKIADLRGVLGRAVFLRGDYAAADAAFASALAYHEAHDASRDASVLRQNRAWCALRLGDLDRAQHLFDQALTQARSLSHRVAEAMCQLGLAELHHARGQLSAALVSAEHALERLETERSATDRLDLRTALFAHRQRFFDVATGIAVDAYRETNDPAFLDRSFAFAEQARGRLLLDALARSNNNLAADGAPHLRAAINKAASRLRRLTATKAHAEVVEVAEHSLLERLALYRAAHERVPALPAVPPTTTPTLDLAGTQALLDGRTVLIQFALGEARSFRWTVTAANAEVTQLADAATIERAALDVHHALRNSGAAGSGHVAERATRRLAELLFPELPALNDVDLVLIASDGALAYVPFAALPSPRAENNARRLLIDDFEVAQIPSASVVAHLRTQFRQRPLASRTATIFGDPVFGLDDDRLGADVRAERSGDTDLVKTFSRLRHAARESRALLDLLSSDAGASLLGLDATKSALLEGRLDDARILHFATHGLADARYPELSGLAASSVDAAGRPVDGFVFAHEIQSLHLRGELAVLSACETGLGAETAGEGLIGLTHSLFRAGVPRVVASLWNVNDPATADLMTRFYSELLHQGASPPAALRTAQLAMRGEPRRQQPYYWAAFVLRGDWAPPATPFSLAGVVPGIRP